MDLGLERREKILSRERDAICQQEKVAETRNDGYWEEQEIVPGLARIEIDSVMES